MRICYLVLLHHKFDQALRLVRRLAGPDTGFVFHIDSAADRTRVVAFRAALQSVSPVLYAPSVRSIWGGYPLALAIVRCVQVAAGQTERFDRYVLLSGQDYPIAGQTQIAEFFAQHPYGEFIEAFPLDVTDADAPGWSPYYRFRRYHLWLGKRQFVLPVFRKRLPPLPLFHGSSWWALTRAAVQHLAEQFESHGRLRRYLRTSFLVDEAYIPTLVMASPLASRVTGDNVTYAEWTPTSGPHPKTLRLDDLQPLLTSAKLFARKFDAAVDESIMNELDALHGVHPEA
jgi:core-2/I-Branching enzyme